MIHEDRLYWHERARQELERALAATAPAAREAHVDLALLHLGRCRNGMDRCPQSEECTFGTTCAVSSRLAGIETLGRA